MNNLGVVEGPWKFIDIFSLDDVMLAFIPEPVISLLFLYPLETSVENACLGVEDNSSNVILIKQTVSNACGTIAILHAIANNRQHLSIKDGSFLSSVLDGFENKTPNERGAIVESKRELSILHEKSALEGQTEAPTPESKTNLHFVCFVEHDGSLYELDGRKNAPILHGSITSAGFLRDACNIVKKFITCLPESVNFSLMALCPDGN
ncbi:Ubiquitin carboxyl-terminal hydrolase isozyme L3 [Schistosoma japonicum]|nr:Ubiquitin carboxyl-terminal hydrolase isozyme L3 [Schistosoma japonicum]KAH8877859.1 Ubiquitin carboxyl-terminal hydrolase isozyme L3 [Schistosoma japonicum]